MGLVADYGLFIAIAAARLLLGDGVFVLVFGLGWCFNSVVDFASLVLNV